MTLNVLLIDDSAVMRAMILKSLQMSGLMVGEVHQAADGAQGLEGYLGGREEASLQGSGAVDHIAFFATGLAQMQRQLRAQEIHFRERTVPSIGLHQLFVTDPSGVVIELNYPAAEKAASDA